MLAVDPIKRISIPEIRHHPWFKNYLPTYLCVPPLDTIEQAKRVIKNYVHDIVK